MRSKLFIEVLFDPKISGEAVHEQDKVGSIERALEELISYGAVLRCEEVIQEQTIVIPSEVRKHGGRFVSKESDYATNTCPEV